MSHLFLAEAAEQGGVYIVPFIVGAVFIALFILAGVVTHSFKDVANRHSHKTTTQQPGQSAHH